MKKKMDIGEDAWALGHRERWQSFAVASPAAKSLAADKPEAIRRREARRQQTLAQRRTPVDPAQVLRQREFCWLNGFNRWTEATVPIHVLLMREGYADGHRDEWGLMTTQEYAAVQQPRRDDQHRVKIE